MMIFFFFQAEDGIRDIGVTGVQTCALPILLRRTFSSKLALENAVRIWATLDPMARAAVQATDRRRLGYVQRLFERSGVRSEERRVGKECMSAWCEFDWN